MNLLQLQNQIRTLVAPTVERMGFDLVAVEMVGDNRGTLLRVSIDGPDGVTIRDCTRISHHLSPVLDEADPVTGAYTLEVSSPGMDRPVQRLEDFQRFAGLQAKIRLVEGHPRRRYTGQIVGVDGEDVLVAVDGEEHRLALSDIERAHLKLSLDEFERLPEILARPLDGHPEESPHDDQ